MRKTPLYIALTAGILLTATACGQGNESATAESSATSSTSAVASASSSTASSSAQASGTAQASPSANTLPATEPRAQAPDQKSAALQKALDRGADPRAGSEIPTHAQPAQESSQKAGYYVFKTPTENIGCDITDENLTCGVPNWAEKGEQDPNSVLPANWILDKIGASDTPELTSRGDAMVWGMSPDAAEVLDYGKTVYHGDFVCSSAEAGLTCWNAKTGHGAFITKDEYVAF